MSSLSLFISLVLSAQVVDCLVHRIFTQNHELTPETAQSRAIQKAVLHERYLGFSPLDHDQHLLGFNSNLKAAFVKNTLSPLKMRQYDRFCMLANVSIGTPPQNVTVEVELWRDICDFTVLGSNVDTTEWTKKSITKHTYNVSASSTAKNTGKNFTIWYWSGGRTRGHVGKDVVKMGDTSFSNMELSILDNMGGMYGYYSAYPVDGVLSLIPKFKSCNKTFIDDAASQLNQPVFSLWSNESVFKNGSSVITLGALDKDNCESDWKFVPRFDDWPHKVNVSSISASLPNGTVLAPKTNNSRLNSTLSVDHYSDDFHYSTWGLFEFFVSATGAVYNATSSLYTVGCDASEVGNVTLKLGNDPESTQNEIVLTSKDLIGYHPYYKQCFLRVYSGIYYRSSWQSVSQYLVLGKQFLNKFCIAHNLKTKELGFAPAKSNTQDVPYSY